MPTSFPFQTIPIAAGETLHLPLARGTVLMAVQGSLQVDEPPRWLADRLVPMARLLGEGQVVVLEQGGWVRLTAAGPGGARLWQQAPVGARARIGQAWRRRLGVRRPAPCAG